MRTIKIERERALACFALRYHCHLGLDYEAFKEETSALECPIRDGKKSTASIANGGKITIEISEEESNLFAVILTEKGFYISNEIKIPAGNEDLSYMIRTIYHPNKSFGIEIEEA